MHRIRVAPLAGVAALIVSVATAWAVPATAVSAGPAPGTVLIADENNSRVVAVAPDGTQTTVGTGLTQPLGVAADADGDVFIADSGNNRVVKVAPDGSQTVVPATGLTFPTGVAVDAAGDVVIVDPVHNEVFKVAPDGTESTVGTGLSFPYAVAVDAAGDVLIADALNNRVVEVAPDGTQTVVPATGLNSPEGVAADAAGDVFITDNAHSRVVKVAPDGTQTMITPGLHHPTGVAVDAAGDVLIGDTGNNRVVKVAPDGTPSTVGTGLNFPSGVAVVPGPTLLPQTIDYTSTPPSHATIGDTYPVTATGGDSGNPVTFTRNATSAGHCTVDNDAPNSATVSFTGHGYCAIFAHQAGTADYLPAVAVRQRSYVYKHTQTINFTSTQPAHPDVGGSYPVSATGGASGEAVTFTTNTAATCAVTNDGQNSTTVTFTARGTCNLDAHQAGTDTYAPAKKVRQRMHVYPVG